MRQKYCFTEAALFAQRCAQALGNQAHNSSLHQKKMSMARCERGVIKQQNQSARYKAVQMICQITVAAKWSSKASLRNALQRSSHGLRQLRFNKYWAG
jgi:hypothetical protein